MFAAPPKKQSQWRLVLYLYPNHPSHLFFYQPLVTFFLNKMQLSIKCEGGTRRGRNVLCRGALHPYRKYWSIMTKGVFTYDRRV